MKDYAELKALIEKCGVHAQLGPQGQGYGIEQNSHELATFLVRMQELGVSSVLEIGTGYKAGLARFLAHEMGWEVTTVDIQDYGHTFHSIEFVTLADRLNWVVNRYNKDGTWARCINKGASDLLFIDGAHDYDSVKHDYETYGKLATKAIAFHDIAGLRECEGARKFWNEQYYVDFPGKREWRNRHLTGLYIASNTYQVIDDSDQRAGIGWIEL